MVMIFIPIISILQQRQLRPTRNGLHELTQLLSRRNKSGPGLLHPHLIQKHWTTQGITSFLTQDEAHNKIHAFQTISKVQHLRRTESQSSKHGDPHSQIQ